MVTNQSLQPGNIVNEIELNYQTAYDTEIDRDTAKTFAKGSGITPPSIHDTPTHAGGLLPYTASVLGIGLTILGLLGLANLIKKRKNEQ